MKTLIDFYSLPYLGAILGGVLWLFLLLIFLLRESENLYRITRTFFCCPRFSFYQFRFIS